MYARNTGAILGYSATETQDEKIGNERGIILATLGVQWHLHKPKGKAFRAAQC